MPTLASQSVSVGIGRSHFANAYRIDPRMRPIESISVPSRSNRTAIGRERRSSETEQVAIAQSYCVSTCRGRCDGAYDGEGLDWRGWAVKNRRARNERTA